MEVASLLLFILSVLVTIADAQKNTDPQQSSPPPPPARPPIKVFILAGQSNMVGMGSVDHLRQLIDDQNHNETIASKTNNVINGSSLFGSQSAVPGTNEYRSALWDEKRQTFRVRHDVLIKYLDASGPLTVDHHPSSYAGGSGKFGPEVMLGTTVGDIFSPCANKTNKKDKKCKKKKGKNKKNKNKNKSHTKEPPSVYLIKAAWGGRSLWWDFRPPSSGTPGYQERYTTATTPTKAAKSHKVKKPRAAPEEDCGWTYRNMIKEIKQGLQELDNILLTQENQNKKKQQDDKSLLPAQQGYEIAGFVWFQGWNDVIWWPAVKEYAFNLANLIRDVRRDIVEYTNHSHYAQLPFVVGELGMHGLQVDNTTDAGQRVLAFRRNAQAVTLLPEFCNSTKYVHTAQYVVQEGTQYDGIYHYWGRAEPYFHIGQALGKGALDLLHIRTEGEAQG
ncbi:hypothetical protein ACA910_012236 [Epithemia clementina (nom. ined.)]